MLALRGGIIVVLFVHLYYCNTCFLDFLLASGHTIFNFMPMLLHSLLANASRKTGHEQQPGFIGSLIRCSG